MGPEGRPDLPPGAQDALPGGATRRELRYGPRPAHTLDLYLPATDAGDASRATLVIVHGGGWRQGDKASPRVVRHKVEHWVGQGVAVASVNYRLSPEAGPLEQADDIARAIAALQASADDWGLDAARLALMGHSAGAHLCALLTVDHGFALDHGATRWLATLCLDTAAYDLEAVMQRPHPPLYDAAFGTDPERWKQASPIRRLQGPPVAPMLLVHSTGRPGSAWQARRFAQAVCAAGGDAELMGIDLSHAEINELAGAPGTYTQALDAFLRRRGLP